MAPDNPADVEHSALRFLVFVVLAIVVLMFCVNDLIGLHNDGGLLSIAADIKAVDARIPEVEVDRAGLCTIFVAICAFVVGGIGALVNANIAGRGSQMRAAVRKHNQRPGTRASARQSQVCRYPTAVPSGVVA